MGNSYYYVKGSYRKAVIFTVITNVLFIVCGYLDSITPDDVILSKIYKGIYGFILVSSGMYVVVVALSFEDDVYVMSKLMKRVRKMNLRSILLSWVILLVLTVPWGFHVIVYFILTPILMMIYALYYFLIFQVGIYINKKTHLKSQKHKYLELTIEKD